MGVAWPTNSGNAPSFSPFSFEVSCLAQYCVLIGWVLENVVLPKDAVISDDKIGLLKIPPVGTVVKDVGIRVSEDEFYVMREQ